jgi:hypothetical protein
MTPIYATRRANLAKWWTYQVPTDIEPVLWDGRVCSRHNDATGFWNPWNSTRVDAPDNLIKAMPEAILQGYIIGDEFMVTGFPHFDDVFHKFPTLTDKTRNLKYPKDVEDLPEDVDDPELFMMFDRASMMDEWLYTRKLGSPCYYPEVITLPSHKVDAYDMLKALGPNYVARHPDSCWSASRTPQLVTTLTPLEVKKVVISKVIVSDVFNLVDYVETHDIVNVDKVVKVIPLYLGDDEPDCSLWNEGDEITVYEYEDQVIGYE